jgi:hypothetical protein
MKVFQSFNTCYYQTGDKTKTNEACLHLNLPFNSPETWFSLYFIDMSGESAANLWFAAFGVCWYSWQSGWLNDIQDRKIVYINILPKNFSRCNRIGHRMFNNLIYQRSLNFVIICHRRLQLLQLPNYQNCLHITAFRQQTYKSPHSKCVGS